MRRTLAVLLILALAACSDDDGGRLDIADVRIVKVRGDQSAVAGTTDAAPLRVAHAGPSITAVAGDWTPEPLVGRIEAVGARTSGISGPSMLPPDMLAHWAIDPDAGTLLAASTPPDDSLHIVNRWAPGTKAGTYRAVARRILADGTVHEDEEWTLVVEPGPVATVYPLKGAERWFSAGDTIDARSLIDFGEDAHGNRIDPEIIGEMPDSLVTWTVSESRHGSTAPEFQGAGWGIVVPSMADYTPVDPGDGNPRYYRLRLHIVVDGAYTPEYAHVRIHVDEPE